MVAPSLSLGPLDAPEFEFTPAVFNPIIALLIEQYSPLSRADHDTLWVLLEIDGVYLQENSAGFFRLFEQVCRRVVAGELRQCDVPRFQASEYKDWLRGGLGDGRVTDETVAGARGWLDFLASHPEHWPAR